jgi:Transglutaminase-like superfamily
MRTIYFVLSALVVVALGNAAYSQDKINVKYGKIAKEDLAPKVYSVDSNANAVILADMGTTEIVGNNKGWFSLEFKRFRRVHILNKNGYDIANVEISLYKSGQAEEKLNNLRAMTYNLENGQVVESKMDKSAVFTDKQGKNWITKKFTLPNVKEGCIIDYEYTVESDFLFNLQPWEFQGEYPRLWSEYNVTIPYFFHYIFLTQGYFPFHIKKSESNNQAFIIRDNSGTGASETYNFRANVAENRWVMKDVPALKEESYTSTLKNHNARIEFQLAEHRDPLTPRQVMSSWPAVAKSMMEDEDFGATLNKDNGWLNEVTRPLVQTAKNDLEKAQNIYYYVLKNFTCTGRNARYLSKPLKAVLKDKNGTVADINLLLIAMLNHENVKAYPVILSTRSHGYTYPLYPLMDRYNYVVAAMAIGEKEYFLDASYPNLGFGKLPYSCYNGSARLIADDSRNIEFSADSIKERKVTSVFASIKEDGTLEASKEQLLGFYESLSARNEIAEKGKEEYVKELKKAYGQDISISNMRMDSLDRLPESVLLKHDLTFPAGGEDIVYISPLFGEATKNNPFKSAERFYPVEMPFTVDEMVAININLPENYTVDEIPKSISLKLNEEGDGTFEYRISHSGNMISLRSKIVLKRTYYMPEEYELLREFFNIIVKKHSEQIVLKKKK